MEATLEELLLALGEKTAENFILRKQADQLQQEVKRLSERVDELQQPATLRSQQEAG